MSPEETQLLLNGPALERPEGVVPGTLNEGEHTVGYAVVLFSSILCALAVMVRIASRAALKKAGIEDALIVCALGFKAGEAYIVYAVSAFPGILIHQWDLQLKYLSDTQYQIHVGTIFYGLLVMCLKVAIMIDWLRLFVPTGQRNWLFWSLHSLIWANIIYYASGTLLEI
ncbi:hypothetical protein DM02DRAFT_628904 [Periconia macrospinosa]|uniref:Rhodopsin domain-containing protein n=1 Tax=Periconia macrospinosa TaxID=97972 RepID=A0A2V1DRM1_9PLEO|nr:hypothetical protein DM02DRAFT_628904 [Periconia macrospinosa]